MITNQEEEFLKQSNLIEGEPAIGEALEDAKIFANYIECLGRTNCEIYKHELKSSADLSLSRIDSAIGV